MHVVQTGSACLKPRSSAATVGTKTRSTASSLWPWQASGVVCLCWHLCCMADILQRFMHASSICMRTGMPVCMPPYTTLPGVWCCSVRTRRASCFYTHAGAGGNGGNGGTVFQMASTNQAGFENAGKEPCLSGGCYAFLTSPFSSVAGTTTLPCLVAADLRTCGPMSSSTALCSLARCSQEYSVCLYV